MIELVPPFVRPLQLPVNLTPIQDVCQGKDSCVTAKTVLVELLVILAQWQKPRINNCMLSALSLLSPPLMTHDHGGSSTTVCACGFGPVSRLLRHSHTFVAPGSGHSLRLSCPVLHSLHAQCAWSSGLSSVLGAPTMGRRPRSFDGGVLVPRPPHTGTTKRTTCSHASSLLDRVVFCACVPSDIEQITRKWLLLQGVAHSERVQGMSIARPVYSASRRVSALGRF